MRFSRLITCTGFLIVSASMRAASADTSPNGALRNRGESAELASAERGPNGALLQDERNTIEVFQRVSPSVVFITSNQLQQDLFSRNVMEIPRGSGSGFIWDKQGHIVTNAHVIQGGDSTSVTLSNGNQYPAKLIGSDPTKDVAVLRIDAPKEALTPVESGDSKELLVGQKVLAIGNPFGLDHTLTTGVVSALGREIKSIAGTTIQDVIQSDASINPGNSGGPLLDSRGRLIGINTAIYSPSGASAGIGFAVPVGAVKHVVPQLIKFGKVKRAGLGISLIADDLARNWGVRGVVIRSVMEGSPAARAGLLGVRQDRYGRITLGDILVGVEDKPLQTYDDLFSAIDPLKPGDQVWVHYLRNDKRQKVRLQLIELP